MAALVEASGLTVEQPMHDVHGSMPLQPLGSEAATVHVVTTKVAFSQGLVVAEDKAKIICGKVRLISE